MRNFFYFCLGLLISVGLFFMPYAHAQMAPYPSVAGPFSPYPPQYNPYLPNPATGAPSAASVANAAGVAATQSGSATVTLPNGVKLPVPVSQTANVSKAAIARAVIGCKGLIGAVSCTATAAAVLAELLDQPTGAGRYRRCPNGVLAFICEAAPGQAEYDQSQKIWTAAGTVCNGAVPCSMPQVEAEIMRIGFTGTAILSRSLSGGTMTYMVARPSGNYLYQATAVAAILPNADIVLTPSTDAAVEQSLQEKMDADYFANRRLYDAMKRDQANSPADYPAAADPVTNDTPVSVSAPPVTSPERDVSVTQSPKPDGSVDTTTVKEKTTITPTTTGTTQGTVKTTYPSQTITTTTVTNNVTNNTATTINTTNNVPAVENKPDDEDYSFVDTGMPEVPELYEQKYPDGISGVWRDNKPNIQGTQFWQGVRSMFPNFGGGQCPAWSMSFNITAASNFGTIPFDVPCWIWQAVGLIMMTTAAFTARKIIF